MTVQISVKIKDYNKIVSAFKKAPVEVARRTDIAVRKSVFTVEGKARS